jgi:hypothetical protein
MNRTALTIASAIAVAGIAASLVIQHFGQTELLEQAEASRQQAEQITQLAADNERLSLLAARTGNPQPLSPDRLSELLRLRGQIGRLREAAREQAQLEAANQQLRAAQRTVEQQLAAARAAPNFWPKDQLAFAGYAEPEAALRTLLWAMNSGDLKSYLACWAYGEDARVIFENELRQKPEAEMASAGKLLSESVAPAVGFHLLDKKTKSPDEVILNLSFDGEGKARKFVVKCTGNEWKVKEMLYPGQEEP